jgi:hypothetical protein
MEVRSTLGVGTTFSFTLPIFADQEQVEV